MISFRLRGAVSSLLASTAFASAAFAQDAPAPSDATPETPTTQSPAPGTNATSVTGETPTEQRANDGVVADETEMSSTRKSARSYAGRADQRQRRTRRPTSSTSQLRGLHKERRRSASRRRAGRPPSTCAASPEGAGQPHRSLPSVGLLSRRTPIKTIGGTLDGHIYDIAGSRALRGRRAPLLPSSQAGRSGSSPTSPSSE